MSAKREDTVRSRRKGIRRIGAAARHGRAAAALAGSAALTVLGLAGPAAAGNSVADPNNIVTNPNFATPVAPAGSFSTLAAGSTALTGWTIGGQSIDVYANNFGGGVPTGDPAATQAVDLDGSPGPTNDEGSITQNLPTTAGAAYTGSFEVQSNVCCSTANETGTLTLPGGAVVSFTSSLTWTQVNFAFIATGSSSPITFASTTPGDLGPVITDVDVDPASTTGTPIVAPAVSAGTVGALGALGMGMYLLRRRHPRATS